MTLRRWNRAVVSSLMLVVLVGCANGNSISTSPPTREPVLPDLVPVPAIEFSTENTEDGKAVMRFSSILANVGDGDFLLRAERGSENAPWTLSQVVSYTIEGAEVTPIPAAELIWGGDGHDHWHVGRVAHYWVTAVDDSAGQDGDRSLSDTKVGFCFFDHIRELDYGPEEAEYSVHSCGEIADTEIFMGMSPGWSDKYHWHLPGQQIEITGLDLGQYRLWAEADPDGLFTEASRENNITWVDFEIRTLPDGRVGVLALSTGPGASDSR